ncbi:MAG TPA: anaerobic ribonucleoside triphosphate reductase [Candidatus Limiplasma sp.]|nr:anaerobic ribonucleoside triphosphate reductase [Candidatus Limiplasma sp.]
MIVSITKRDGRVVPFDADKIEQAIEKSFMASGSRKGRDTAHHLAGLVVAAVENDELIPSIPTVEQVQDAVERTLIEQGFVRSAKAYILYRAERSRVREMNTRLMKTFEDICADDAGDADEQRRGCDTAMGAMLKFGSEGSKQFYEMFVLDPGYARAHQDGDIHIHDLDFYTLTTASTQIDLVKLFAGGFSTGHGTLREPQDISSCAALCCIAIQANQNDQHGDQSIANFDYGMAPGVRKTYAKCFAENLARALELMLGVDDAPDKVKALLAEVEVKTGSIPMLTIEKAYDKAVKTRLKALCTAPKEQLDRIVDFAREHAQRDTDRATHQAMEALVHTLNTMNSRAGGQVSLSTVNYGLDTSPEARMVMRNLLIATEEGVGHGDAPLFPVQIFRVKEGVNYNPGDPNYDLFRLAVRVSAKRPFPHFSFMDAPFNLPYYKKGNYDTEVAYAGSRARVMGNLYDPGREIAPRRGNLSATTVNLPRIALKAKGDLAWFFEELERVLNLCAGQLLERFEIVAAKKARNFPFMMGQGNWLDSETLGWNDGIREILKHGTLSIGFTGLSETLMVLRGAHHGENASSQNLGLEIVGFIRKFCDDISEKHQMNFTCLASPAEGLAGRFVRLDRERFGTLEGITDRECYTNSFHIPVDFPISVTEKIALEAPYHALTNGGHITCITMAGDAQNSLDAFEKTIRAMHDAGIGYGCVTLP